MIIARDVAIEAGARQLLTDASFSVHPEENEEFGSTGLGRPDRSLILKYSRIIDLLR